MVQGVWVADQRLPGSRTFIFNTIYNDENDNDRDEDDHGDDDEDKDDEETHPAFINTLLSQLCRKLSISSLDYCSF